MVAYNFQSQFAPAIKAGHKTHTIRVNAKRRHARPGEMLQLYTGMRTSKCQKICPDVVCLKVDVVQIEIDVVQVPIGDSFATDASWFEIKSIQVGEYKIVDEPLLGAFAKSDGFASIDEMAQFFGAMHGPDLFIGTLIKWGRQ